MSSSNKAAGGEDEGNSKTAGSNEGKDPKQQQEETSQSDNLDQPATSKSGDNQEEKDGAATATTTNNNINDDDDNNDNEKPMSKNQLKRKRKWERAMEVKKRRKQQEKEIKAAKAKAQGRDLEQERMEQLQRQADGTARKLRQEKWTTHKLPLIQTSFQVCIDCSFEDQMTAKEINSLSSQIRYCYANNRRNPHPCLLTITSLSGQTLDHLQKVSGFEEWTLRAFQYSAQPLDVVFQDRLSDVVYLTSDSETTITELENSKIYVIGGIVDRNRLHRAAITRAETLGVATARLPLERYLQTMKATKVLTCNHVFELLLKYRELGNNWEQALLQVLPSRKEAKPVTEDAPDEENTTTATTTTTTATTTTTITG